MSRAGLSPEAVLDAATELADTEGLSAVTLARLAATLGVRAPSLYVHVGGLDDLRRRLADRGAAQLRGELQRAAAGRAGRDALEAVAQVYRAYARSHPGLYEALQRSAGGEEAAALVDIVLAVLAGYGAHGTEAVHSARIFRAALHGFVQLEAAGGFQLDVPIDETFERLIGVLDRGLGDG